MTVRKGLQRARGPDPAVRSSIVKTNASTLTSHSHDDDGDDGDDDDDA